jgi:hypothetical protein
MVTWIPVIVRDDNSVSLDGKEFLIGDIMEPEDPDNVTGLRITLRETQYFGLHFATYLPDGEFLYPLRCKVPGEYYLGANYGYRKKEASEESCPVRKCLRKHGLPMRIIEYVGADDSATTRKTTTTDIPRGNLFSYYLTDAKKSDLVDSRFGHDTEVHKYFNYLICVEEEYDTLPGGGVSVYHWVRKVFLSDQISDSSLKEVADTINKMLTTNLKSNGEKDGSE